MTSATELERARIEWMLQSAQRFQVVLRRVTQTGFAGGWASQLTRVGKTSNKTTVENTTAMAAKSPKSRTGFN